MELVIRFVAFAVGLAIVLLTLRSAVRTFILPRSAVDQISRAVFLAMRRIYNLFTARATTYAERDRTMAFYAPVSLLVLLAVWLALILLGYGGIYRALGVESIEEALTLSGSSLLTLGIAQPHDAAVTAAVFSEATIGLIMVALLIAYLPTMYAAFSKRETAVTMLEVRAGTPPSAVEMILRYDRIHGLQRLYDMWATWEVWFAEVEESHTSLAALPFFRSPRPENSWVTAAGAVLDGAALVVSCVDTHEEPQAALCLRAGYLALRHIADYFRIPYNPAPTPDDPISISRSEFDAACEQLRAAGVPMKADAEQSWRDFRGWRVNYDTVLLALASLTLSPYALWSSDRSLVDLRKPGKRPRK
jgi:hypothetical protein